MADKFYFLIFYIWYKSLYKQISINAILKLSFSKKSKSVPESLPRKLRDFFRQWETTMTTTTCPASWRDSPFTHPLLQSLSFALPRPSCFTPYLPRWASPPSFNIHTAAAESDILRRPRLRCSLRVRLEKWTTLLIKYEKQFFALPSQAPPPLLLLPSTPCLWRFESRA